MNPGRNVGRLASQVLAKHLNNNSLLVRNTNDDVEEDVILESRIIESRIIESRINQWNIDWVQSLKRDETSAKISTKEPTASLFPPQSPTVPVSVPATVPLLLPHTTPEESNHDADGPVDDGGVTDTDQSPKQPPNVTIPLPSESSMKPPPSVIPGRNVDRPASQVLAYVKFVSTTILLLPFMIVFDGIRFTKRQFMRMFLTNVAEQVGSNAIVHRATANEATTKSVRFNDYVQSHDIPNVHNEFTKVYQEKHMWYSKVDENLFKMFEFNHNMRELMEQLGFDPGNFHKECRIVKDFGKSVVTTPINFVFAWGHVLTFLDGESLKQASCVNKQWNIICYDISPILASAVDRTFRLNLNLSSGSDGIIKLVHTMKRRVRDAGKTKYLNGHTRFELHLIGNQPTDENRIKEGMRNAINETSQILTEKDERSIYELGEKFNLAIRELAKSIRMDEIVSLVVTTASNKTNKPYLADYNCNFFSQMFPQLRALNLSDHESDGELFDYGFQNFFSGGGPYLTKFVYQTQNRQIAWCGIDQYLFSNLKEIHFDNHMFFFDYDRYDEDLDEEEVENMQFLDYFSSDFKLLERLSIRNARYFKGYDVPPPTRGPCQVCSERTARIDLVSKRPITRKYQDVETRTARY